MKALVTGFEPFGTLEKNPSWEAVKLIGDQLGENVTVKKLLLPVEYERSAEILLQTLAEEKPDVIICTGVATKRCAVMPEYLAVNVMDSPMPDNSGKTYLYEKIEEEGEAVLYTSLPFPETLEAIHAAGVPCAPSFDAGTYVCNTLFYRLMADLKYNHPNSFGGFIHLPPETKVASQDVARALEAVVLMMAKRTAK